MGEKSARKNDAGERETDGADRSAERTQRKEETTDGRSDAPDAPTDGVRVAGRAGPSRGQTRTERSGGSRGTGEGYVDYERGPDPRVLSERYGMEVRAAAATRLQRLESKFGGERVQRWADEGMSVETMGKPRDMQAFRERQAERSEEIPADVERRNEASVRRNAGQDNKEGRAGTTEAPDEVRSVISSPGRSMDETVRREMESKMGGDFSDVQLHTGPKAASAANSINARAFTIGNHIAFKRGEYNPGSEEGKRLLAHELAHVRQQRDGRVSLLPEPGADHPGRIGATAGMRVQPKLEVSSPDDPTEKEAERVAEAVMEMDDDRADSTDEAGTARRESRGTVNRSPDTDAQTANRQEDDGSESGSRMLENIEEDGYTERAIETFARYMQWVVENYKMYRHDALEDNKTAEPHHEDDPFQSPGTGDLGNMSDMASAVGKQLNESAYTDFVQASALAMGWGCTLMVGGQAIGLAAGGATVGSWIAGANATMRVAISGVGTYKYFTEEQVDLSFNWGEATDLQKRWYLVMVINHPTRINRFYSEVGTNLTDQEKSQFEDLLDAVQNGNM